MDDRLRAILDRPDDDDARLAYAETCEPARAEFIRVQVELARLPAHDPRHFALRKREEALLKAHQDRWLKAIGDDLYGARFRRGFVEEIHAAPDAFVDRAETLFARTPLMGLHALIDGGDDVRRFLDCPFTDRLRMLSLADAALGAKTMDALLRSPRLQQLEELRVGDDDSTPEIVRLIAGAPLPRLTTLVFAGYMTSEFKDAGAGILAGAPARAGLLHLYLINCGMGPEAARHLARSRHLTHLRSLDLGEGNYSLNKIGAEGVEALAQSPTMAGLEFLNLDFNFAGDAAIDALGRSPHLTRVESLLLQANSFGDASFARLARSEVLARVRILDLSHNAIGPKGVAELAKAAPPALTALWLYHNPVGNDGVRALVESDLFPRLTELNLTQTGIDDAAADLLLATPSKLMSLRVDLNEIGDDRRARLRDRFDPPDPAAQSGRGGVAPGA